MKKPAEIAQGGSMFYLLHMRQLREVPLVLMLGSPQLYCVARFYTIFYCA